MQALLKTAAVEACSKENALSLGQPVRLYRGNRSVPAVHESVSLAFLEHWRKGIMRRHHFGNLSGRGPKSATKSGGKRRTQSRQLGRLAPQDLPIEYVRLKLHEPVVLAR